MSAGYLLPCRCGKKSVVFTSQAGEQVACECGEKLDVPTLRGFSQLERGQGSEGGKRLANERSRWNPLLGIPAAIFFGFAVVSFGLFANACYWRYQINTSYQIKDEIENGEKKIDTMQPVELLLMYRDFRGIGLGQKSAPIFYENLLYAKEFEKNIRFYAIALAGSLALAIGLTFLSRRK